MGFSWDFMAPLYLKNPDLSFLPDVFLVQRYDIVQTVSDLERLRVT